MAVTTVAAFFFAFWKYLDKNKQNLSHIFVNFCHCNNLQNLVEYNRKINLWR